MCQCKHNSTLWTKCTTNKSVNQSPSTITKHVLQYFCCGEMSAWVASSSIFIERTTLSFGWHVMNELSCFCRAITMLGMYCLVWSLSDSRFTTASSKYLQKKIINFWPKLFWADSHLTFKSVLELRSADSCWMSESSTGWWRGQLDWLNNFWGLTCSHSLTTSSRSEAESACWNASFSLPWCTRLRTVVSCACGSMRDCGVSGRECRLEECSRNERLTASLTASREERITFSCKLKQN